MINITIAMQIVMSKARTLPNRCPSAAAPPEHFPPTLSQRHPALFPWWGKLRTAADGSRKANMPRIDDLSDAEFMKLQAEYGDSLPICPICTLEDVRHALLKLVAVMLCRTK